MAIKMDGHTITELKLKASDGSEVTKQLTEEGTIPTPTEALSITANGTYDVTTKASAVVAVPAPEINLQTKTATTNGDVVADAGYDGLAKVTVAVSGDVPTLITKSITANGTYNASADSADGYSSVTVNVPAPVLPTLTNPASASDILSGKEALDGNGAKLTGTCTFDADTSDADAIASDIAEGKTAYVNGVKVTGTASGGGASGYELLKTVTVDTDARAIPFDWETDWAQYDSFLIICNATLSTADYLYFGFSTTTHLGDFLNRSALTYNGLADRSVFICFYDKTTNTLYKHTSSAAAAVFGSFDSGTAYFYTYNASNTIQTGSVFKIYGAKLPTE